MCWFHVILINHKKGQMISAFSYLNFWHYFSCLGHFDVQRSISGCNAIQFTKRRSAGWTSQDSSWLDLFECKYLHKLKLYCLFVFAKKNCTKPLWFNQIIFQFVFSSIFLGIVQLSLLQINRNNLVPLSSFEQGGRKQFFHGGND